MAQETPQAQPVKKKEKNINGAGQAVRIVTGVVLIALGGMAVTGSTPVDPIIKAFPVINSLLFKGGAGAPTGLYSLGGGLAALMGILAIVQGATGRCWMRAMGFKTPI
ncbi:MAG: hypothetical protein HY558_06365 [Euryarchaeota archaeon]|nr:hypothetical protein [Euryarchaeota archaeon]